MNSAMSTSLFPRREFLKTGGALVIGLSLRGAFAEAGGRQDAAGAARGSVAGPPDPKQIDTWLAIHSDNTATVYIGYVDSGKARRLLFCRSRPKSWIWT